jgi:excisionase family DNA binding protein
MSSTLMSTRDLASYLGVPIATLYRWRVRGEGPRAIRLGRALHWRREEVERWLDERTEDRDTVGLRT